MTQHRIGERTITRVGCGDVRLATAVARNVDARDVERAVHSALELGITLIEAADEEAAERLAGDAVRAQRLRDTAVVACRVPELASRPGAPKRDVLPEHLPIGYVQERIEASLRATRLDALPLVQLSLRAAWRTSSAWPELAGACARLVREGKVLAWGAFLAGDGAEDAAELAALLAEPWLETASIPYNLCERGAEPVLAAARGEGPAPAARTAPAASAIAARPAAPAGGIILLDDLASISSILGLPGGGAPAPAIDAAPGERPLAASAAGAAGKPIFARRPLAGGALAGTLGPGVRLSLHDDRGTLDDAALERIAVLAATLASLVERTPPAARSCEAARAVLERGRRPPEIEARTLAELALRFVLARGAIPLPRLSRAEHVPEALAAAYAPPLSEALLERLDALARDT